MTTNNPIQIILVDDHTIIRQGLKTLIEKEIDMIVVGEADNGRNCVEMARTLHPNVIIMDITLPDLNGIEATRLILKENPDIKVIALSMHSNHLFVEEMNEVGACGYLLKSCVFDDLVISIRTVLQNKQFFSPKLSKTASVTNYRKTSDSMSPFSVLTGREREVLQLIAEGKTSKEISDTLCITIKTVEKHRHSIKEKLDLHTTAELTKYAIKTELTTLDL